MKRKKIISSIMLFILLSLSLVSCTSSEEASLKSKVESKTIAYKTDLEDSLDSFKSNNDIKRYLTSWAKSKNIPFSVDSHNNVIMSISANEQYSKAAPTVIIANYDHKNIKNNINQITTALYLIKNNENTGDLSVIFVSSTGNDFSGIKGLSKLYFPNNTNVFCLNNNTRSMWSFNTAGITSYEFKGNIEYTEPEGNNAIEISISGMPGGIPNSSANNYNNPIKKLTNLLAYFKSHAKIFELAQISGGNSSNLYPQNAKMTIVLNNNYLEKVKEKIDSTIKDFNDDIQSDYPNAKMEYKEVPLPKKVLTKTSLDNFISSQYTLLNGTYMKDDSNKITAVTNIGQISMDEKSYTILASATSMSSMALSNITDDYKTICGLSNLSFKKINSVPIWDSKIDENNNFAKEINKAFNDYTSYDMEYKSVVQATNTSFILNKNKNCNIVELSYTPEKIERYAGTILTFMLNQPHTETDTAE